MIAKTILTHLPPTDHHRNVTINIMAYAWEVSMKKQNNFLISFWSTVSFFSKLCTRVDIVLDMYQENSIKVSEQRWKTVGEDIERIISGFDQPLPAEIDRFWSVSNNKTSLQQLFTKWVLNKVKNEQLDKPLSLGGSHKEHDAMCVSLVNGLVNVERFCPCKPRNKDRKLWKCCYSISWHRYICIHTTSWVMVCFRSRKFQNTLPHSWSRQWFRFGLVEVLPAIHALNGCDTANKVSTKSRAVREKADYYQLLYEFDRDALSDEMIADAEKFLLKCITKVMLTL